MHEVASDLVRDTYSKRKSITWFTSSHEGDESTDLFLDMDFSEQRKGWRQNFFLLPRGRGVMAIMVGSFTLQLPTSASVATSRCLRQTMALLHVWWQLFYVQWI